MKILDKIKEKLRNHIPNNVKHIYLRFGKNDNRIIGCDDTGNIVYITHAEIYTTTEGKLVFMIDVHNGIIVVED